MDNTEEQITDTDKKIKLVNSFIFSTIITVLFIVIVTIAGELYSPLKNLLTEQHYHHWVGKGIWSAIIFFVVGIGYYFVAKIGNTSTTSQLLIVLAWALVLALIALLLFFTYEFFIHV